MEWLSSLKDCSEVEGCSLAPVNSGVRCLSFNARLETKMKNEGYSAFIRGKIVAVCEAILDEEIGVVAGSRRISDFECELDDELDDESYEDLKPFIGINSETQHLPVNWERRNWSAGALERKDKEIAEAETFYKDKAFAACRKLIARFDINDDI
jgi:hypothetical protein